MTMIIPQPADLDVRMLADRCDAIDAWAADCEVVKELYAACAGLAAIDEYLARTSIDGRARVSVSQHRLEVRIGVVLGPAPGRGHAEDPAHGVIPDQRRGEFREMAAHPEIVEQVLATATDEQPASRARILAAIRDATRTEPPLEREIVPDAYEYVDAIFNALFLFNQACGRARSAFGNDDLTELLWRAVDTCVDPRMQGGLWLSELNPAILNMRSLRPLTQRGLRKVQ